MGAGEVASAGPKGGPMRRRPRAVFVGLLLSLVVMLAAGPASFAAVPTDATGGTIRSAHSGT